MLLHPYRDAPRVSVTGWDIHGLCTGIAVQGTLNHPGDEDRGWTVEVAIPWADLARWALRQIYYAQRNQPRYQATLKALNLENLTPPPGWTLRLEAGSLTWAASAEGDGVLLTVDAQGAVAKTEFTK